MLGFSSTISLLRGKADCSYPDWASGQGNGRLWPCGCGLCTPRVAAIDDCLPLNTKTDMKNKQMCGFGGEVS